MRILLVEDEILIQKSLQKLMQKKGAEVTCTAQGKEAIDLIMGNEFDRIICDLMLSDITGFDIIEEVKKKYSPGEMEKRFIIITAYSSEQVLERAREYGCQVLKKPFEDLASALDLMLQCPS